MSFSVFHFSAAETDVKYTRKLIFAYPLQKRKIHSTESIKSINKLRRHENNKETVSPIEFIIIPTT